MDSEGRSPQEADQSSPDPGPGSPGAAPAPPEPGPGAPPPPVGGYPPPPGAWGPQPQSQSQQAWPGQPARPLAYGPPVAGAVMIDGTLWLPAGFGPRFFAFILDWALLGILHAILVAVVGIPRPDEAEAMELFAKLMENLGSGAYPSESLMSQFDQLMLPANFSSGLMIAMCAAYYIIFHGMLGATVGKMVLGLRVLRRDGQPINYGIAALRYVVYYLTGWLAYTGWLTWITREKRTAHDFAAATNVFKAVTIE